MEQLHHNKLKTFFHAIGLSCLGGAVFLQGLTFIDILHHGYFTAVEHNPVILSFEIMMTGVSIVYFAYLYVTIIRSNLKKDKKERYNIRDPTYQEMKNFIRTDKTNERTYNASYNCYDFTNSVCNNAFKVGYHCGFVWMDFPDIGHAITCFNTTDHSLIFIEPQYDQEVVLIIGKSYSTLNGFDAPPYNDTIVEYGIIW